LARVRITKYGCFKAIEYTDWASRKTPAIEKKASNTKNAGPSCPIATVKAICTTRSGKLGSVPLWGEVGSAGPKWRKP
jgi:hypothetical protein